MITMRNPSNGYIEKSGCPFLWTLIFGSFYFLYKGSLSHTVLSAIAAMLTGGLSWFVYPFFAKTAIRKHYLNNGWVEV
jgi:hypothetical protein